MQAHLLLDRAAPHGVAFAHTAVAVDLELGHHEQRDAANAGRRIGQPGQDQVDDVVGEIVLSGSDEDLLAGDGVAFVAERFGAGLEQPRSVPQCGSVRTHGAGPPALDQRRQEHLFLPVLALLAQGLDGAMAERGKLPGHVGAVDLFLQRGIDHIGQALAALRRPAPWRRSNRPAQTPGRPP